MSYKNIWEKNGIYQSFHGIVIAQEVYDANNEVYEDPRFSDIKYAIWDSSGIDQLNMNKNEATVPAIYNKGASLYVRNIKQALIVKNEHTKGLCTHYIDLSRRLSTPWKFKLFDSIEDARRWVSA